jgi:DAK2 domain fusion protein YloV
MLTGDALYARFDVTAVRATLVAYRDTVRRHAGVLNRWNVYPVPDGDTGTNMARTLDATVEAMEAASGDLSATCAAISHGSLMGARGNSGVILSQLLRGFASTVASATGEVSPRQLSDALQAAATAAYGAVVRPKEGTILTVAREAAQAAALAVDACAHITPVELLRTVRSAAREALARTPQQLPALAEAGVVDAGAAGFVLFFDAALFTLDGEPVVDLDDLTELDVAVDRVPFVETPGSSVADLRYEVMFFLDLADTAAEQFKQAWARVGDSIVVVGGDGLWNCHIHTNDIGAAVEAALDVGGRPHQIRVTDLFDDTDHHDALLTELPEVIPTCAVVAVANGDGIAALLTGLGVACVVTGGQTMNPSTAELIDAVASVVASTGATQVVLLPNNTNIIPVALQVDAFVTATVSVVPTRSVIEALSALVVFDPHQPASNNAKGMSAAMSGVRTGEITCAVRDATTSAGAVRAGDWLGLASGEGIVTIAPTLTTAVLALAEHMVGDEAELVTVLVGDGAIGGVDDALRTWFARHRPNVTVDWHRGDQPLYPYLFGVE